MSFYTTLKLYRPSKPPRVTGPDLALFLRELAACNIIEEQKPYLQVKFGIAIDQDDKPTMWDEPINDVVSECREIEWDLYLESSSIAGLAEQLESYTQAIYRSYASLDGATESICQALTRESCPDNEQPMVLCSCGLEVGPVMLAGLGVHRLFHAGWLSVDLSGYGFVFPWTYADLLQRAERHPDLQRLKALCRRTWPVSPTPLEERHFEGRRLMGDLWPYPIDEPLDWHWGVAESG
jgi:hypothetical protein